MKNIKLKSIPYREYHNIANQFLKQIGFNNEKRLPLNIEAIIEKAGYSIIPKKLLKREFGTYGIVVKKIAGFDIFIDFDHYMDAEFYNQFTLAEELSHIILHSHYYNEITTIESAIILMNTLSQSEYDKMEQQARVLASCILLPANIFDNFVIEYIKNDLNSLQKENFFSKEDLADYIADKLSYKLSLSKYVISRVILSRYPNLLIDKILNSFGLEILI